ncbi:MAG TPA: methionyl-tRNA formyltransferase [Blastocatellia bacterium]|nr:methionyl-tRNA formyltransferase [Blastocatellia bacterium]
MKMIFMGTPELAATILKRLIEDRHNVPAVFTQPDRPSGRGKHLHAPAVKQLATERGITVHQPSRLKNNDEVRAVFETIAPDVCIVAAYGKILPAWLLAIPRLGCINVHASLLPKYRGAAPINWAIANGEKETGVTIMQMDAGMDTGPMLATRSIDIGPDESAPELTVRISRLGADLLSETLPLIERGFIKSETQDNAQASYAPMLKREDGRIDWNDRAQRIANRVRGFQPWPGSYSALKGHRLTLWRAKAQETDAQAAGFHYEPGTVVEASHEGFTVACGGESRIRVEEVQAEGKRRMSAWDFANGIHLNPGSRFE